VARGLEHRIRACVKTSNRYHGIYLNTGPGSDGTPLCHDLAGIAVDRARPSRRPMI
jgi:hypothetical protein